MLLEAIRYFMIPVSCPVVQAMAYFVTSRCSVRRLRMVLGASMAFSSLFPWNNFESLIFGPRQSHQSSLPENAKSS